MVISIIGLISSIALASLGSARDRAADAAIKANLLTVRSQSEILYDAQGTYSGLFNSGSVGGSAYEAAIRASGYPASTAGNRYDNVDIWRAAVRLRHDNSPPDFLNHWCVDSLGASRKVLGPIPEGGPCPPGI